MPHFAYRAADRSGRAVAGVLEAADARAVIERLQRDAVFPIQVVQQAADARGRRVAGWAPGRSRVKPRDLVAFTQQLATLLEAGVPLDRALGILQELAPSARLRTITDDLLARLRGGSSLADSLWAHHPRPFSRLYVNMVRAGEKGGVLESTLRRLAEFMEETQAFRDALVSALIYPTLLTTVGAAAVVFLLAFVIPRFADIFRDLGGAIPLPTQVLLEVSSWLQRFWWVLGLGAVTAAVAGRALLQTSAGRLYVDTLLLRVPVIREVLLKTEVARFTRIQGTLLRSGVPLVAGLVVVREMMGNQLLTRAVASIADGVRRGAPMARPMKEMGLFPPLAVHLVRVGEETGRLEEMLLKVGEIFEADTRKTLGRVIGLAEPCIILVLGLVVGFIVLSMLLAIFSISELPL
jgi:general secretion pathway protein F